MIKVGLISLAHMHGLSYGRALKRLEHVEFTGIYDRDRERRENIRVNSGGL